MVIVSDPPNGKIYVHHRTKMCRLPAGCRLNRQQIWWFWRFLRTFPWADRAHTLGFCSTHGYYKTLKYGPDRPTGRFSKIAKTTKFAAGSTGSQPATGTFLCDDAHRFYHLEGPTLSPHNGLGWYRDCSIRVSMIV